MRISGRESGVGGSPKSVADNGGCVATGEANTVSVTWIMASVTRDTEGTVVGILSSLGKLDLPKVELRAAASILQPFDFVK